ncbi:conjugative transposon TraJ protein [Spirosoma oryzae]|uniref:Conjugative transposon TraJ protein n=1 Tax=Spirosoma oryzae TaxID=1469603 RepID=A0A2T0S328_9BACT|nr:hypothetical protein [Spirosoma oryzae]PRY27819.1 conjugative transposon TraJ protein [Spirosoma oryzae]
MLTLLLMAPDSIESALDTLLTTMYGQSSSFINLGKALGGFGSIMYLFYRIWGHMARNEEIDVFPLLRPVALALCLMFYTSLSGGIVSLSQKLDEGTQSLMTSQQSTVTQLNKQKDDLLKQRRNDLYQINPDLNGDGEMSWYDTMSSWVTGSAVATYLGNATEYYISKYFDEALKWLGEILYDTASIAIKFLQTFFLLVLIITGPITFGLACFEWFYGGLAAWLGRVIHLLLWLPLTNLLGGMLEQVHIVMLRQDILQLQNTPADEFTSLDFGLVAFYLLGTAGYLMIPKAASWIVESTGAGGAVGSLQQGLRTAGAAAGSVAGAGMGSARMASKAGSGMASLGSRLTNKI